MEQFELNESEDGYRLTLAPLLDMGSSKPLRAYFLSLMTLGKKVIIDASNVERMSTPCVQVILSATHAFEAEGVEYSLFKPSEAFINAFDELGMFPNLMQWKVES